MRIRRFQRGFTLVESVIAMGVLTVGVLGLLQTQILMAHSSKMAKRMMQATSLAREFTDAAALWPYTDPRLAPGATVSSLTDSKIDKIMRLSHGKALTGVQKMHFGENANDLAPGGGPPAGADANAMSVNALGTTTGAATYEGTSADVDGDGKPDFARYWSVFALDTNGDGTPEGKFVVVTVRWFESGVGYREVQSTTFLANPQVFVL